jgi:hypothetical protein
LSTDTLHIHQADGLALRWDCEPCVDLFLANPPYLAAKNTDLSGYQSAHQRGQADSYLLFLNLGLQIVRPNGWLGLVLPDAVLARTNAAKERARLLKDFTIHHLWHLAGVFAAQVGAVVIVAQKCAPKSTHLVSWMRGKWERNVNVSSLGLIAPSSYPTIHELGSIPLAPPTTPIPRPPTQATPLVGVATGSIPLAPPTTPTRGVATVPQSLLLRQPRAELRYLLNSDVGLVIERLRAYLDQPSHTPHRFAPLNTFVSIRRGEELGRKSSHLIQAPPCDGTCKGGGRGGGDAAWYPVLRGGRDVRPYAISFNGWWIPREAIVKPLERYSSPKLLVVKSTNRLQAALDTQGRVALQTLYLLHPYSQMKQEHEASLYFLLALLNSRLLQTYIYVLHTAYKWVQPQIDQHVLARLPIPIIDSHEKQQIIERSRLLACACSELDPVVEWKQEIQGIYEEQERAICALYNAALPGLFC